MDPTPTWWLVSVLCFALTTRSLRIASFSDAGVDAFIAAAWAVATALALYLSVSTK